MRRTATLIVTFSALLLLGGCALSRPPMRPGSLPFPGALTLYAEADPMDLGRHHTDAFLFSANGEVERGIVYTRRGGFLDIAHMRLSADWTRRFARDLYPVLLDGRSSVSLGGAEPTSYRLMIAYPDGYTDRPVEHRESDARRWTVGLAGVMGWTAMTWHEFATYFGYKSLVIIPEDRSAFSYDDGVAHLLGVAVAQDAMREVGFDDARAFNDAVTERFAKVMRDLEAVPKQTMREAIASVKGTWWDGGQPLLRQLDMGWHTQRVTPWIVPGYGSPHGAVTLPTPGFTYDAPDGLAARIEIDQNIFEAGKIRSAIGLSGGHLRPERDFAPLAAAIAEELEQPAPAIRAALGEPHTK